MKKLFFLGALFAVGLGFTACSSDKDVVAEESPQNPDNGGGNYITIGINLPTANTNMTRATDNNENVTYNDGMPLEYAVKDAYLLIFSSSNVFKSAYKLDTKPWTDSGDGTENVTQYSTRVVQKVESSVTGLGAENAIGDQMLVVLNGNDVISGVSADGSASTSITVGNKSISTSSAYSDVAEALVTSTTLLETPGESTSKFTKNGFFMANAPLSKVAGSGTSISYTDTDHPEKDIRILVPITATYETEAAAYAAPASSVDQIYVERAVAKVTFDGSGGTGDNANMTVSQLNTGSDKSLTWLPVGWILDNTNKKSYVVRNMATPTDVSFYNLISPISTGVYRYIGNQQISFPTAQTFGYRTYFAQDPNYTSTEDITNNFNRVTTFTVAKPAEGETPAVLAFPTGSDLFGPNNPQYCFENTFEVAAQNVNQTTLVQVAIQAKNGSTIQDLYTLGANKTVVYTLSTLEAFIKQKAYEYLKASDAFTSEEGITATSDITNITFETVSAGTIHLVSIEITNNLYGKLKNDFKKTADSKYYLADDIVKDNSATTTVEEGLEANVIGTITKYANGISYYNIRIKHYGDLLTPWNGTGTNQEWTGDEMKPGGTHVSGETNVANGIYPIGSGTGAKQLQANKYLGRYGVLRNNWYDLKVNKVRMLGEAIPHTDTWPGTPDDELDNYITFQINILSWAKHPTQSADL